MLIALSLVVAACSGDGSGSVPATTAPAATTLAGTTTSSSTTTSTAPTSTTSTTTTTVPPGVLPQQLVLGFDPETVWIYEAAQVATVEITAEEAIGGVFEELDESSRIGTSVTGSVHRLVLERPDGRFELIDDFRPEAGELSGEIGTFTFTQELGDYELDEVGATDGATIVDTTGARFRYDGGAPGYHPAATPFSDAWGPLGPPLPQRALDVGDTWDFGVETPLVGKVEFRAEVTAEVEHDGNNALEIEYRGEAIGLPVNLSFEEAVALSGGQAGADLAEDLEALARLADEAAISITAVHQNGRYLLDPVGGTVLEQHTALRVEERLDLTADGESVAVTIVVTSETDLVLDETSDAGWPEVRVALAGFTTDAWRLADRSLNPLLAFELTDTPDETLEGVAAILDQVTGDLFAGLSYLTVVRADGTEALVLAITGGGEHRGAPYLAEELLAIWAGYNPALVRIDGTEIPAYRATVSGAEWLVWSGRSQMFVVVGNRAAQQEVIETLVGAVDDYLWEAGDCLDFGNARADAPYAPYGPYGLTHCEIPHGWEVLWSVGEIADAEAEWSVETVDRVHQECGRAYFDRFDRPPGELGLQLTVYQPDPMEWERGDRYGACVLSELHEDGIKRTRGRIDPAAARQPIELEAGMCLAGPGIGALPVPCTRSHVSEVLAVEEFAAVDDGGFPGLEAMWEAAEEVCPQTLAGYGVADGPYEVEWTMLTDAAIGWEAGVRTFSCVAFVEGADGFPLGITGSFTGDWGPAVAQVEA